VAPPKGTLAVMALHLRSMWAMPSFFLRVRRMERMLKGRAGVMRYHRWVSRRSLLLTVWWERREEAEAWLDGADVKALLGLAGKGVVADAWVSLYVPWGPSGP